MKTFLLILVSILFVFNSSVSSAQKQFIHKYEWTIYEDSLVSLVKKSLSKKLGDGFSIKEDSLSVRLIRYMLNRDRALKFDFKQENMFISSHSNSEKTFRIITWFFLQAPGYIVYRGVVQFKNNPKLIPLFDQVRFMKRLDNGKQVDDMDNPKNWYGAYYYDMIPYATFDKGNTHQYLLLGKRQDHVLYDTKIIDVLNIHDDQTISFGDFFDIPRSMVYTPSNKRFVILHKKNVGTVLVYDEKNKMIVFDMLDTEEEEQRNSFNNKMYFIPTGLYHGFKYKGQMGWVFVEKAFEQMTPKQYLEKSSPLNNIPSMFAPKRNLLRNKKVP